MNRPGWRDLLSRVQPVDTNVVSFVVSFLDRFSRHFEEDVQIQAELTARDIGIVALRRTSNTGRLRYPSRPSPGIYAVLLYHRSGTIRADSQEPPVQFSKLDIAVITTFLEAA